MDTFAATRPYDLETIESVCLQHGLTYNRVGRSEIEVAIEPNLLLVFANTENGTDTYVGFREMPWHAHGRLLLMNGEPTYVEYDPSELLMSVISGEVLVVTTYVKGQLKDRWLAHRDEKIDIRHIEAGEEIRLYRLAERHAKEG